MLPESINTVTACQPMVPLTLIVWVARAPAMACKDIYFGKNLLFPFPIDVLQLLSVQLFLGQAFPLLP